MAQQVLLASFNADNSLSYNVNFTATYSAQCTEETIYILNGKRVGVEDIRKIAEKFATPASIDIVNGMVISLEIATK